MTILSLALEAIHMLASHLHVWVELHTTAAHYVAVVKGEEV